MCAAAIFVVTLYGCANAPQILQPKSMLVGWAEKRPDGNAGFFQVEVVAKSGHAGTLLPCMCGVLLG